MRPPEVTIEENGRQGVGISQAFYAADGLERFPKELGKSWHYHHIFTAPFYYIEYGLSWLGALQLWQKSL